MFLEAELEPLFGLAGPFCTSLGAKADWRGFSLHVRYIYNNFYVCSKTNFNYQSEAGGDT